MDKELPRVLVPTITEWRDSNGNRTLPEIFSCWDRDKVAQIYTRAPLPDTAVCDRFLRINESDVLKSIFKRSTSTTKRVYNTKTEECTSQQSAELEAERKRYASAKKHHSWFLTLCREAVWFLGKWKTPELDAFVEEFNPQMLFCTIFPFFYAGRIQLYLIKKCKVPVVGYLFDDNYSYKPCGLNPFAYIHRFLLRQNVKKLVNACDELFVISPMQKEECDRLFGTHSTILTRPIDTDTPPEFKKAELPIKMVYTGNMRLGRLNSLCEIAKAVSEINKDGEKIRFDIYSADTPGKKERKILSTGGTHLRGCVPSEEIPRIIQEADITVFTEDLGIQNRFTARLSFSTKLTDYFTSGRCIFALAHKDIAPTDYLKREDAAITVTSYKDIEKTLRRMAENPQIIEEYGKKAYECGVRNHSKEKVLGTFREVMLSACNKG
ncbi:MAG: hypothetical protein Q4D44_05700 [Eubacteriales bacterium]|nr:hypothetical protein [Eubacteriales bacterium]